MKAIVFTLIFCFGFSACKSQRNIVAISDSKVKPKEETGKAKQTNQTNPFPSNQTNPFPSNQTNPSPSKPGNTPTHTDPTAGEQEKNELCSDDLNESGNPDSCACPSGMKYDPEIFACIKEEEEEEEEEEVPPVGNVSFYGDGNFAGKAVSLAAGSYTLAQLLTAGMTNDAMSSLKVPKGWTVTIYRDDNFSGANFIFTEDTPFLPAAANDQMSSVKIQAP